MRRTKEQAAETRIQLLVAAETLFLEQGYETVSLEEIAAAAGTSRGALHWHFGNKRGLLRAIGNKAQLPLAELADCLSKNVSTEPLALLSDLINTMFSDLHNDERQRQLYRVIMHMELADEGDVQFKSLACDAQKAIARILIEANRQRKLVPPWTPSTAASALTATITGVLQQWALERSDLQLVPYAQVLVTTLIKGFCSSGALVKREA